jgi:hypothetical protein
VHVQHSTAQHSAAGWTDGWRGNGRMQVFDAVSGERRRRCGWMRCFRGDVAVDSLYLVLVLVPLPAPVQAGGFLFSTALLAAGHCSEAGSADTPPFFQQRPSDPTGRETQADETWGRYRYPRAASGGRGPLLVPVPVLRPWNMETSESTRWVPKTVLPTCHPR